MTDTMQPMTLERACVIAAKAHDMVPDDREWIESELLRELRELASKGTSTPATHGAPLLPCPFCGGEPVESEDRSSYNTMGLHCPRCGVSINGPGYNLIWNKRSTPTHRDAPSANECVIVGCTDEGGPWVPTKAGFICEAHWDDVLAAIADRDRARSTPAPTQQPHEVTQSLDAEGLMGEMVTQARLGHKQFCVGVHPQTEDYPEQAEWEDWSATFDRLADRLAAHQRTEVTDEEAGGAPAWAQDVSPQVVELCAAAEGFLSAQRCNAVGMGAGSGMMNAAEDRAARELERAYDRIPRRYKTEALCRLHDALRSVSNPTGRVPSEEKS